MEQNREDTDSPPPLTTNENGNEECFSDTDSDADDEMDTSCGDGDLTRCLFCEEDFVTIELAMQHLLQTHKIDFTALKNKFNMDQYSFIQLINCIRSDKLQPERLLNTTTAFWQQEKYLKPGTYETWLTYDYEAQLEDQGTPSADDTVTQLQKRVKHYEELLAYAHEDMQKMRSTIRLLMDVDKEAESTKRVTLKSPAADEGYFSSYAHFGIHHEMLSDKVRTNSYRSALLDNAQFVAGKDVLDVGCGTGILSIFASQAGACKVLGIDNSDILYNAMDIVKQQNINNVQLVKGRLEDTTLPQMKYDIIISEWMGYFLLFEGMLDTIIYARERHLAPGGIMLPNRCTMSLVGYGSDKLFAQHVSFWDNVYGLNMSTMREKVLQEPLIDIVDAKYILTEAETIADLDMASVGLNYSNFSSNFNMKVTQSGQLSAFVGYFDTFFDLPQAISFSTGPRDTPTHWKQVVFFLGQPLNVKENDIVSGNLTCRRSHSNARSLDIAIQIAGQKYKYYLD